MFSLYIILLYYVKNFSWTFFGVGSIGLALAVSAAFPLAISIELVKSIFIDPFYTKYYKKPKKNQKISFQFFPSQKFSKNFLIP